MGDNNAGPSGTGAIKKENVKKGNVKKERKEDQPSISDVVSSASNMPDCDKLAALQGKYYEFHDELRRTSAALVALKRQYDLMRQDSTQTHTELTETTLVKTKLESLIIEFQKQVEIIENETIQPITRGEEEEESHREVVGSFTEELTSTSTEAEEERKREREERFSREIDLKIELQNLQSDIENERTRFEQERQVLIDNFKRSKEMNRILEANQQRLQYQLETYRRQYRDTEGAVAQNTKVFKTQLENEQAVNATLKEDIKEYSTNWKSSNQSIAVLTELNRHTSIEVKVYERKVSLMERINRQLQAEIRAYHTQLMENNISPNFVPELPDNPPESPRQGTGTPSPPGTPTHADQETLGTETTLIALKGMESQTQAGPSSAPEEISISSISSSDTLLELNRYALYEQEAVVIEFEEDSDNNLLESPRQVKSPRPQSLSPTYADQKALITESLLIALKGMEDQTKAGQSTAPEEKSDSSISPSSSLTELSLWTLPLCAPGPTVIELEENIGDNVPESPGQSDSTSLPGTPTYADQKPLRTDAVLVALKGIGDQTQVGQSSASEEQIVDPFSLCALSLNEPETAVIELEENVGTGDEPNASHESRNQEEPDGNTERVKEEL